MADTSGSYARKVFSWAVPASDFDGVQRVLLRTPFSGNIDFFDSDSLSVAAGSPCSDLRLHYERSTLQDEQASALNIYIDGECLSETAAVDNAESVVIDGLQLTQILVSFWFLVTCCGFLGGLLYGFWHYKFRNTEIVGRSAASDQNHGGSGSRTDETAISASTLKSASNSNSANNASLLNYADVCSTNYSPQNKTSMITSIASSGKHNITETVVAHTLPTQNRTPTNVINQNYGYGTLPLSSNGNQNFALSDEVLSATVGRTAASGQLVIMKESLRNNTSPPPISPPMRGEAYEAPHYHRIGDRRCTLGVESLQAPGHVLSPSPSDACLATFRLFNNERAELEGDVNRTLINSTTEDDFAALNSIRPVVNGSTQQPVAVHRLANDSLDSGFSTNSRSTDSAQLRCTDIELSANRRNGAAFGMGVEGCESNSNSSSRASSEKQRRTVTVVEPQMTMPIPTRAGRSVVAKEYVNHRQPIREEDEEDIDDDGDADDFERDELMSSMRPLGIDDELLDDEYGALGQQRHVVFDIRHRVPNGGEFFVSLSHDQHRMNAEDNTWQRRVSRGRNRDRYDEEELLDARQSSPEDQSAFFFNHALRSPLTNAKLAESTDFARWQPADAYCRTMPHMRNNRQAQMEDSIDAASLTRRRPGTASSQGQSPATLPPASHADQEANPNANANVNGNGNRRRLFPAMPGMFNALLLLSAVFAVAIAGSSTRSRFVVFTNTKVRELERRLSELDANSYSKWNAGAHVNLTVFVPMSLVRRIDLIIGKQSVVNVTADFALVHDAQFDLVAPSIDDGSPIVQLSVYETSPWSSFSLNTTADVRKTGCPSSCEHLCDPVSRSCVCKFGYRGSTRCSEVDECELQRPHNTLDNEGIRSTSLRLCRPGYECVNAPAGSYQCVCADDRDRTDFVYGATPNWPTRYADLPLRQSVCFSCAEQCPLGYYASMQCATTAGRYQHCSRCTVCPAGYYVLQQCTSTHDTRCAKCSTCIPTSEFEVAPCSLLQNRVCRSAKQLPGILSASSNVLTENQRALRDYVASERFYSLPSAGPGRFIKLDRGTNYSVRIQLHELNPVPQFRAVDHQDRNDDTFFRGNPDIRDQFCEHPLPESYSLFIDLYENVTTKAKFNSSAAHLGYEMDLENPCKTGEELQQQQQQVGNFPEIRGVGCHRLSTRAARILNGIVSSSRRLVVDGINIDAAYQTDKSRFLSSGRHLIAEEHLACARMKAFCQQCMSQCGQVMTTQPTDHECGVSAGDEDNGYSARLPTCFSCCATQNCTSVCNSYYSDTHVCNTLRCVTGTVLDVRLLPSFHKRGDEFYCHVEPDRVRPVYSFSYQLFHRDTPITLNTTVQGYFESFLEDTTSAVRTRRHQFLKVRYTSALSTVPDIVYGLLSPEAASLRVGRWNTAGSSLLSSAVSPASNRQSNVIRVRPIRPFAVSSSGWRAPATVDCTRRVDTLLDNLLPSDSPTESVEPLQSDFYTLQQVDQDASSRGTFSQLVASLVGKSTYSLRNQSSTEKPSVLLTIDRTESVLVHNFPRSNLHRDSLRIHVQPSNQQNQLLLNVSGTLQSCRGSFVLRIYSLSNATAAPLSSSSSSTQNDVSADDSDGVAFGSLLYDYDVATNCPNAFELQFAIPSVSPPDVSNFRSMDAATAEAVGRRTFLVRVLQADGEIRSVVSYAYSKPQSTASPSTASTKTNAAVTLTATSEPVSKSAAIEEMSVFGFYSTQVYGYVMDLPFELPMPVLLGLVGALSLLATIYVILYVQMNQPALLAASRADNHLLQVRHVFFFAISCCSKLAYSAIISFTIFATLFLALNSTSLTRLRAVPSYMVNLTAENELVIELINSRMNAELNRFNARFDARFNACDAAVEQLYGRLFTDMRDDATRDAERLDELRSLLDAARARAVRKLRVFNDELYSFVSEFNQFADDASAAIVELATGAYKKLADANTAWLTPANTVYRTYLQRRAELQRSGTYLQSGLAKPFDEWINVATDVQSSAVDLRIDLEIPVVDVVAFERLFEGVPSSLNHTFAALSSNGSDNNPRKPPPLLNLPRTILVEPTGRSEDDPNSSPDYASGTVTSFGASNGNKEAESSPNGAQTAEVKRPVSSSVALLIAIAVVCDLLLFTSRYFTWKTSANYALNGYPVLLNVTDGDDADANADGGMNGCNSHAYRLGAASDGSSDNEQTTVVNSTTGRAATRSRKSKQSRPSSTMLSVLTTLLERDWLLGIAALVVAFFTLDLINVATDKLADGRVLNARFGIYSRLLDPVNAYEELSSASLTEYKSFVLDRYLSVYENSLNNDLRLLEAFRTAWSSAKLTRRDAIRRLVRAMDSPSFSLATEPIATSDGDALLRKTLSAEWSSQVRSNVSQACRFDDLVIDEVSTFKRSAKLVTQSEFDYNLRLAHLVDSGEAYFSELRLLIRRTTFLLFVYIAITICFTFVSRFCELLFVRLHLVRLRFVYTITSTARCVAD